MLSLLFYITAKNLRQPEAFKDGGERRQPMPAKDKGNKMVI